jgi:hypothetical protein
MGIHQRRKRSKKQYLLKALWKMYPRKTIQEERVWMCDPKPRKKSLVYLILSSQRQ